VRGVLGQHINARETVNKTNEARNPYRAATVRVAITGIPHRSVRKKEANILPPVADILFT
jgi:hypothetical protein